MCFFPMLAMMGTMGHHGVCVVHSAQCFVIASKMYEFLMNIVSGSPKAKGWTCAQICVCCPYGNTY